MLQLFGRVPFFLGAKWSWDNANVWGITQCHLAGRYSIVSFDDFWESSDNLFLLFFHRTEVSAPTAWMSMHEIGESTNRLKSGKKMQPLSFDGSEDETESFRESDDAGDLVSSMIQQWPTKFEELLIGNFLVLSAWMNAFSKESLQNFARSFFIVGIRRRMQSIHTNPLQLEQMRPWFVAWNVFELLVPLRTFPYCFNSMDLYEQSRQRRSGLNKLILTFWFSVITTLQGNSQRKLFKEYAASWNVGLSTLVEQVQYELPGGSSRC